MGVQNHFQGPVRPPSPPAWEEGLQLEWGLLREQKTLPTGIFSWRVNFPSGSTLPCIRNKEKGVLAKGVSAESSVTAKEIKNTQGYWPQQYMWHSERHIQEKRTFCKNPPLKTLKPFSWFLIAGFIVLELIYDRK